jgi:hypothetical protein
MPTHDFRIAWLIWALTGLGLEIWALADKESGDTLTEQVRWVLSHPFMWWCGIGLAIWTAGHFFFGWR